MIDSTDRPSATHVLKSSAIRRTSILLYCAVTYVMFLGVFLYAIGFVGGFGVPTTLDGAAGVTSTTAIVIDLVLLAAFALQHSIMARPVFKQWWTRFVPESAERSTYVLFSNTMMIGLFLFWEPVGGVVWDATGSIGSAVLYTGFAFGWGLVLVSTFLTSHWDLFGLRQGWLQFRGIVYTPIEFVAPLPYRIVRHPLYLGWLLAFWLTPFMTASHLVFAVVTTAYILIAIQLEERDLVEEHAEVYQRYQEQVPMILPAMRKPTPSASPGLA